jgi:hypothetical protein
MSLACATKLWGQFVGLFQAQDVKVVTNTSQDVTSWTPATHATFDMGVIVIGTSKVGCLWVEEED